MPHSYEVRLFDNTTGELTAIFDNWASLFIEREVNRFAQHQFSLDLDDSRVDLFERDTIVEVWRSDDDIPKYREYVGLHVTPQQQILVNGSKVFTSYGRGLLDLLKRRTIRYYAGSAQAAKSGVGETVIKEYVGENAGAGATAPPRITAGVTTGLSIAADTATGSSWTGSRPWQNLLDVIQEIGYATRIDFDVVRIGDFTWEFRTYFPQQGTNRQFGTATPFIFQVENNNMAQPLYVRSATEEVNDVLVLGQGEDAARVTAQRTIAASIAESPINLREDTRDARQESTVPGLNAVGDAFLQESKAQEKLDFIVIQGPTSRYGLDYFLGDLVTARFQTVNVGKKIQKVSILVTEGKEEVRINLGDIVT